MLNSLRPKWDFLVNLDAGEIEMSQNEDCTSQWLCCTCTEGKMRLVLTVNLHCKLYSRNIHCTVHSVHCTVENIRYTLHTVH